MAQEQGEWAGSSTVWLTECNRFRLSGTAPLCCPLVQGEAFDDVYMRICEAVAMAAQWLDYPIAVHLETFDFSQFQFAESSGRWRRAGRKCSSNSRSGCCQNGTNRRCCHNEAPGQMGRASVGRAVSLLTHAGRFRTALRALTAAQSCCCRPPQSSVGRSAVSPGSSGTGATHHTADRWFSTVNAESRPPTDGLRHHLPPLQQGTSANRRHPPAARPCPFCQHQLRTIRSICVVEAFADWMKHAVTILSARQIFCNSSANENWSEWQSVQWERLCD